MLLICAEADIQENLSLLLSVLSDRREICHFLLVQSKMRENLTLLFSIVSDRRENLPLLIGAE